MTFVLELSENSVMKGLECKSKESITYAKASSAETLDHTTESRSYASPESW